MKKRNIFEKRLAVKPYEYPELLEYKDSISHSFWLWSEYNYTSDIQDFKVGISGKERNVITRAMLSISQIEVTVKRFWSNIYNYFPKPEIDMVGVTFGESECYSEDTEIFTEKGWVKFPDLGKGVKVAAYNLKDGSIDFEMPKEYICKEYSGIMHHYKSKQTDMLVTENHELYFYNNTYKQGFKRASSAIKSPKNYSYPISGLRLCEKTKLTDLERLLIAIQADGMVFALCPSLQGTKTTRITVTCKKQRKQDKLENLLNSLEVKYTKTEKHKGCYSYDFHLGNLVDDYTKIKNFGWVDLNNVSSLWAEEFIDELANWDCHRNSDNRIAYYNTNLEAIEKVQVLGMFAGYRAIKGINRTKEQIMQSLSPGGVERKQAKDLYIVALTKRGYNRYPKSFIEIDYSGKVYCVNISTGMIITRRNGKIAINGNCRHLEAYSKLLELLGMNEMFERLEEYAPLMKRVQYMEEFMENKDKNSQEFILSLILFSLFVEHISLYSQFYTIQSFNKHKNQFKGISNVISATFLEEDVHGNFGIALYRILRTEHSELFTDELFDRLIAMSKKAFEAECEIVDWIFEEGDLDFITKEEVLNYVKYRYHKSFTNLGLDPIFEVDEKLLEKSKWFELEQTATKETDFFNKRSTDYSKKTKAITSDDLF